jgi:serine/threonine protein kinase
MNSAPSRLRIGNCDVLCELSSGGMGKVYLARRLGAHGFEKLVAIKTIRGELGRDINRRAMFLDEARLAARLNHSAIAQVYDFGEESGLLYLVMEYVQGISLRSLIKLRPSPIIAARLIEEVCRGLHAAHELADTNGNNLGVVHRDVSPENLMLTYDGGVKILDFGIAFHRDRLARATQACEIRGKPAYMSPDQIQRMPVDRRTDVFAVSVVLYEMLTARPLFHGDNVVALIDAVLNEPIPAPSTHVSGLPEPMDAIVMRGLERRPELRFQTALEMADTLAMLATNQGAASL